MFLNLNDREPNTEHDDPRLERPSKYRLFFAVLFLSSLFWNLPRADFNRLAAPLNLFFLVQAFLVAGIWTAVWQLVDYYVWPPFVVWFAAPQKTAVDAPEAEAVPPPQINLNGDRRKVEYTAVLPVAAEPVDDRLLIGSRYINLADYGLSDGQWQDVMAARRDGRLPAVSTRRLHAIGISRQNAMRDEAGNETRPSDAARTIGLMLACELIESTGDKRPYKFTEAGRRVLPSPTLPRLEH